MSPVKIVYELVHFFKIRKQNIEIPIMLENVEWSICHDEKVAYRPLIIW